MKETRHSRILLVLFCLSITSAGVCFFLLKLQLDNKYASWPQAEDGILVFGPEQPELLFLWAGWEFYPDIALTPDELDTATPRYIFIGELSGFGRDKHSRTSGGSATYRLTVQTTHGRSELALEVPYLFGDYRIWVNGQLRQDGSGGGSPPYLAIKPADGRVEIVVAVESHGLLYDGMVYPPAFGSSAAVWSLLQARAMGAAVLCFCALTLGMICLVAALWAGGRRLALSFALLCLCYTASILRIPLLTIGLPVNTTLIFCRVCYYGIFLSILSILVEILEVRAGVRRAALAAGGLMCLWVLAVQLAPLDENTAVLRLFGATVAWYKYGVALFFTVVPAFSALRERRHALPLLAGGLFFATALFMDRLYPGYEPAFLQWPVETAAMVQLGVIAWVFLSDAVRVYGNNRILETRNQAAQALAEAQSKQYTTLARHFDEFSRVRHDIRSLLIALQNRLARGEYTGAEELIRENLGATNHRALTENSLVNAILTVLLREAEESGFRVRTQFSALPPALAVEDIDLCILFSNLIRNAMEAAVQSGFQGAVIDLSLRYEAETLFFSCTNPHAGKLEFNRGWPATHKKELGHGLGLKAAGAIVAKYGGVMTLVPKDGAVQVLLLIHC